jgi:hypothetical protein
VSAGLTFTCGFVLWAGVIAIAHFAIDALKCVVGKRTNSAGNHILFFADQLLHLGMIYVAVLAYTCLNGHVPGYIDLFTAGQLLLAAGFLLCMKPANIVVRVCLASLKTETITGSLEDESLQKAGRWIGSVERLLAFVLILLGQYTAIGFIIAAKSVLRYGDKTHRTEYVLIGTLLSFGIVFALGVGITSGVFENMINIISYKI